MKIDYSDIDPEYTGVAVTGAAAEDSDPRPAIISHADAIHTLERITEQIANILFARGVDAGECAASAYDIRNRWTAALRTATDER